MGFGGVVPHFPPIRGPSRVVTGADVTLSLYLLVVSGVRGAVHSVAKKAEFRQNNGEVRNSDLTGT